jgi:hypothetical protein
MFNQINRYRKVLVKVAMNSDSWAECIEIEPLESRMMRKYHVRFGERYQSMSSESD